MASFFKHNRVTVHNLVFRSQQLHVTRSLAAERVVKRADQLNVTFSSSLLPYSLNSMDVRVCRTMQDSMRVFRYKFDQKFQLYDMETFVDGKCVLQCWPENRI